MKLKLKSKPARMLFEVLHSLLKKPATVLYPKEKLEMAKNYRGRLVVHPEKCIGCLMCMRDCPTGAININKIGEKKFEAVIDLSRCIYCGQCAESCPKKAIELTTDVEIAQLNPQKLKVVFHAKDPDKCEEKSERAVS